MTADLAGLHKTEYGRQGPSQRCVCKLATLRRAYALFVKLDFESGACSK